MKRRERRTCRWHRPVTEWLFSMMKDIRKRMWMWKFRFPLRERTGIRSNVKFKTVPPVLIASAVYQGSYAQITRVN